MQILFTRGDSNQRGSSIVIVMMILVALMALSLGFFRLGVSSHKRISSSVDDRRAFLLAEAGLNESLTSLRAGASGGMGSMADPVYLADGLFWVEATDLGSDRAQLVVTALSGSGRESIEAVVDAGGEEDPLFVATLNSKETITVNEAVVLDSYDSSLGTYASQATNVTNGYTHGNMNGNVRSNQHVIVNARANIFGDAIPGPGHNVTFSTDSYVSGSTTPAPEAFNFPAIDIPSIVASGDLIIPAGDAVTLAAGDHAFDALSIGNTATLVVTGPSQLVVSDFSGFRDGRLQIDATAGPVSIFVRNSYFHDNGFEAEPVSGSPMALAFMLDVTQDITFPAGTKVRGAYYAPNANIAFTRENEAWGAFAANRLTMSSSMRLHYDEALLDYFSEDTGQSGDVGGVLAWTRRDVRPDFLKRDRRDPFQLLGLDRTALRTPIQAWE